MLTELNDYSTSGLTIREAMVRHVKLYPDKSRRPDHILWGGLKITTSDIWIVPQTGIIRAEFLSAKSDVEQGFDIEVDGWLELAQGERIPLLRTWHDERFEGVVEYPFVSEGGRLWVWNVYKMKYPGGQIIEERWTENAGFWVEQVGENERLYHCSHGMASPPDFDALVFKVSVRTTGTSP